MRIQLLQHPVDGRFGQLLGVDVLHIVLLGHAEDVLELVDLLKNAVAGKHMVQHGTRQQTYGGQPNKRRERKPFSHEEIPFHLTVDEQHILSKIELKVNVSQSKPRANTSRGL